MHGAQRTRHAFSFANESERCALLEKSCVVGSGRGHTHPNRGNHIHPTGGGGDGGTAVMAFGQLGAVRVVQRSWRPSLFAPERLGVRKRKGDVSHVLLAVPFSSCRTPAAFVKLRPSPCSVPGACLVRFFTPPLFRAPKCLPIQILLLYISMAGFVAHYVTMPRPWS